MKEEEEDIVLDFKDILIFLLKSIFFLKIIIQVDV